MKKSVKRIMLIGWDGAPPPMVESMMAKGLLKNFSRLAESGTFIRAMNPYPTITASNWTTLSTGAWPGRHGVTGYSVHHPGDPLDEIYSGFNTAECSTEHIWDSAEKSGKKCVLVHYETSWPPTLKNGIVVGGSGPNYQDEFHAITPDLLFSTEVYPGLSDDTEPVEIEESDSQYSAVLRFTTASREEKAYWCFWKQESRRLSIYLDEDRTRLLTEVEEGEWSEAAFDTCKFDGKDVDAGFKFKLLHLPDEDDDEFKLLCTSITPVREIAYPNAIGKELVDLLGPYSPRGGWEAAWSVDPETYLEYLDMHHDWLSGACKHLLEKDEWHLLYTQTHCHDYVHHLYMRCYDPLTAGSDKYSLEECESYMERAYESADRMLGEVLECADDETLVAIVSDHGATTWLADVDIRQILIDRGFTVVDEETGGIVWEKTKAIPQRACYVYVNVKGRDPDGIVEPGEEYETVRDQIIEAFYDYVEPETGKRPFSMVLKREDARTIGLHGPRVGDIVYALHTEFGHEHGQGLSTARLGRGSLGSIILLNGPGIKKGYVHEGMTGIQDVVPTLCYMADIPFPKGCEGAIIYDALEDPSFKMKERAKLEKELARWKESYEKQVSITHARF